ncbi:MAG: PAS domain-containing methyl-accepting chemotaxis protein [Pirellulaceae bacterium]
MLRSINRVFQVHTSSSEPEVISQSANDELNSELKQWIQAIQESFATIEFDCDGTIRTANPNFLKAVGYDLHEIVGKHHRIFVESEYGQSPEYARFWRELADGQAKTEQFCRVRKDGSEIWIQASYMPLCDREGTVTGVMKIASDINEKKREEFRNQGKIHAIDRAQAVIEFQPDGTIVNANQNFLTTLGYSLDQIVGKHHRIFVDSAEVNTQEYDRFWKDLRGGEFKAGRFKRVARDGKEVWIQGTYNPIFDSKGRVTSVVKFATDITDQMKTAEIREVGNSVAASTTQMTATIREISESVSRVAELAGSTEELALTTSGTVKQLSSSSREIEQVVATIQQLADQTKLLALNAQIESARAGEAGRGFSVVANEVKELAHQTGEATAAIEETIRGIQRQIESVVDSTSNITTSVADVNSNMNTIAAAIEEQSVTMESLDQTARKLQMTTE